jgi:hypothetical protein
MAIAAPGNWNSEKLLANSAQRAMRYTHDILKRSAAPSAENVACLELLAGPLPHESSDPSSVLAFLCSSTVSM